MTIHDNHFGYINLRIIDLNGKIVNIKNKVNYPPHEDIELDLSELEGGGIFLKSNQMVEDISDGL